MRTKIEHEREHALDFARAVAAQGFAVYLAQRGNYGFYTDGKRVVSFSLELFGGGVRLTGNYRPGKNTGTGWHIRDGATPTHAAAALASNAPRKFNPSPVYTTPEEHLQTYGESSGYSLLKI